MGPVVAREPNDGTSLAFLDLIEILFVKSFRKLGVPMSQIREASQRAVALYGSDHPFAVRRFETDGKTIFATRRAKGSRKKYAEEVVVGQSVFFKVISPFFKEIDYHDSGDASRWWPLGRKRPILVDPEIAFGAPVTKTAHVPVFAINAAIAAGESPGRVAKWFDIPLKDVRAAAALEQQQMAA